MPRKRSDHRRHLVLAAICAGFSLLWTVIYLFGANLRTQFDTDSPLIRAENAWQDHLIREGTPAPLDPRIVYLGIDKSSEDRPWPEDIEASPTLKLMQSRWPWSRKVFADATEKLLNAGAQVVALDLLFTAPNDFDKAGDNALKQVLAKYPDRIILAQNMADSSPEGNPQQALDTLSESIVPENKSAWDYCALVNFWADGDSVIRRVRYQCLVYFYSDDDKDKVYDSLSYAILKRIGLGNSLSETELGQPQRIRFAGPPGQAITFRPLYDIFVPSSWQANYDSGKFFEGKIVLIGPAGNWTQDKHQTPFALEMFGPELHLHVLNAALQQAFYKEWPVINNAYVILALGALALAIVLWVQQPVLRVLGFIIWTAAYLVTSRWLFDQKGLIITTVAPLLSFNTCGAACLIYQFVIDRLEKSRFRSTLEKYVSRNVVQEILAGSDDFQNTLGGSRKPCTVLFSDIRGFTTMTEGADSQALVQRLNEYLSEMVDCVFAEGGTLDKFIGDAVMAVWGNTPGTKGPIEDAVAAVSSAMQMCRVLERLNHGWERQGLAPWKIGIGLNHGDVIVGNMGSPHRKEFTVIGDPVNLASRLEGITKEYGLQLVLGESVARLVAGHFLLQTVDLIVAKGKTQHIDTFAVLEKTGETALKTYEEGVRLYRKGDFKEALAKFKEAAPNITETPLAEKYIKRCEALIANPPEGEWTGIFEMKTK